ncbi:hypothetical protein JAAARDRAFT_127821 [Jaapia argillacea MUCL 33604]|uniref:Uncharacterized protein n=1 Tax=Jaapia argillacea MUCL 33604 TaxID=933084 RepID=A0A067PWY7_9AGAM|nr:hypothetical protein JAAARDRAFT_127821 [Jaapia argillacea MUCL 33604]
MSPRESSKQVKVKVPRHNAQRVGPAMTAELESLAKEENIVLDVRQPSYEPGSALAQAIENASEWNSLLMTARAARGPQWDIGTQQFFVDEGSDLQYDPSPLAPKNDTKEEEMSGRGSLQPHDFSAPSPSSHRHPPPHQYQYGMPLSPAQSPRQPSQGPYSSAPFNAIHPSQFYGDSASPVKMAYSSDPHSMTASPDMRRRSTRNMTEDSFSAYHGQ